MYVRVHVCMVYVHVHTISLGHHHIARLKEGRNCTYIHSYVSGIIDIQRSGGGDQGSGEDQGVEVDGGL